MEEREIEGAILGIKDGDSLAISGGGTEGEMLGIFVGINGIEEGALEEVIDGESLGIKDGESL